MVSSRLSPNTDNKPAVGRKLALIAMVVVLSKIWPQRRCALAVNRWFNGCRRHGGVLRCGRDDRLEVELQPVLNLCGDSLKIFCIWYNATTSVAADDYLRTHRPAATRSRLINGGCNGGCFSTGLLWISVLPISRSISRATSCAAPARWFISSRRFSICSFI